MSLLEFVSICGVVTLTAAGASQGLQCLRRTREHRSSPHTGLADEGSSGRPAAGAWHEPRYGKRHAVCCPIEYLLGEARYEGSLVDMSRRGWRAQGRHPVAKGAPMMVRILSSDPAQCITIDEAVVPIMYEPHTQQPSYHTMRLVIRGQSDAAALTSQVREQLLRRR